MNTGRPPMVGPLAGISVLVTRPAHQARHLHELIAAAGGRAVAYPVIEIRPWRGEHAGPGLAERLGSCDIGIFISANAVHMAFEQGLAGAALPARLQLAAVGAATAAALEARGHRADIVPARGVNSEALLAHPVLQAVQGQRILILRGHGGRELLGDMLKARGARIDYAEVYQRIKPENNKPLRVDAADNNGRIDLLTLTSREALHNLIDLTAPGGRAALYRTPLVVGSERVAAAAAAAGFVLPPVVADSPADAAMLAGVCDWAKQRHGHV